MDLKVTLDLIIEAARAGRFLSYLDVARAHGRAWDAKVRSEIFRHLDELNRFARDRGLPLLSVMVTNRENLQTGKMNRVTLDGFVKKARERHGMDVVDPEEFVSQQQREVMDWARSS